MYECRNIMNSSESIKMYKTFIQPYFLYAIEIWGHTVKSDQDILNKIQSKILRIIFNCKRSEDAWRHSDGHISSITNLYVSVIKKLCMKHHCGKLPHHFSTNIMPEFNINQLENRISQISLSEMYNYRNNLKISTSDIKTNCINHWNSLPMTIKSLPYISASDLYKHLKNFNQNLVILLEILLFIIFLSFLFTLIYHMEI